ncbi:hypothetical protein RclHR1_01900021 [Rhizophagus clarus]|jgi:hypothetical protein|uniref:DUF7729 domain-containing protein n=1 Tax=Rhizophagus clarus TaxID=94130 RepID=A0A2Z6RGL1_9GLOM|nr:hypothetical protein RclHR1_01900021 [Rhizophagus clarus]GES94092.1 hypothetical protein RCL_jg27545.t1 [Rhizophagus clarus]
MKLTSLFTPILLVAAAGLGLASNLPTLSVPPLPPQIPSANPIELIGELSPQCQAALFSVVANPEFFECVPVAALLPVLTDPEFLPSFIKDPITNGPKLLPIFDATCSIPKCSDEGVKNAIQTVTEGCAADIKNPLIQLALGAMTFYSPVRDIICFKDNKDEYCLVETFTNILSLPAPPKDFKLLGGIIDKLVVAEPRSICTPCNKAILNTVVDYLKENPAALALLNAAFNVGPNEFFIAKLYVFLKCGFEFMDGKIPDPSKIDPGKFVYQVADDKSLATQNEINLMMLGSLLASAVILN